MKVKLTFFFLIVFILLSGREIPKISAQTQETFNFWFEVGEEEYVYGPTGRGLDNPFFTLNTQNGIKAFSANANTHKFSYPGLTNLILEKTNVLGPGTPGSFDECGAWLNSIYIDPNDTNHYLGWYHAEAKCNYNIGKVKQSVAFAESFDGGNSWTKRGQVLTADSTLICNDNPNDSSDLCLEDDVGNHKVIQIGDYFYMFFLAGADWKIHIARSKVAEAGKPGTWEKYYNGSWGEPGLGG